MSVSIKTFGAQFTSPIFFYHFILDKEENCRTFVVHFIPEGGETCQFPWQAFLCLFMFILYGGSIPPCRMLMHLLPSGEMQRERRNRSYFIENLRLPPYS